jgi:hypothetical protein
MRFNLFVRRLHLYLALSLIPWFLIYGVSSIPFAHNSWIDRFYRDGKPTWSLRFEKPYEIAIPEGADLREIGARIKQDVGLEGAFGAYRPNPGELTVYVHTFWTASHARYFPDKRLLRVEDRRFRWDHFLTGMHARGGFQDRQPLNLAWSIVVDLVCIGFLLWIASGIYMWWQLPQTRVWGFLALGSGAALFALFLVGL